MKFSTFPLTLALALASAGLAAEQSYEFRMNVTGLRAAPAFSAHTFTSCGSEGLRGPSLADCQASYGTSLASDPEVFSVLHDGSENQGIQVWTVPASGTYEIEAAGATPTNSGTPSSDSGLGIVITNQFQLTEGQKLWILVGQDYGRAIHGGGGSFVVDASTGSPLIVAGGGGGRSGHPDGWGQCRSNKDAVLAQTGQPGCGSYRTNGGTNGQGATSYWGTGGAGFHTNSGVSRSGWDFETISFTFLLNNQTTRNRRAGTFGGGGIYDNNSGGQLSSGGGGGYSGGGTGKYGGGGGGSFVSGSALTSNQVGHNPGGHGYVEISLSGG
jgi:hypothetical protein